jgi:hypothetical protein
MSEVILNADSCQQIIYCSCLISLTWTVLTNYITRSAAQALNRIRELLADGMKLHLEGPGNISLFAYDNNTFIVESFLAESIEEKIVLPASIKTITDIKSNEKILAAVRAPRFGWTERIKRKNQFSRLQ